MLALYKMHIISSSNMIPNHVRLTQLYDVIVYKYNNVRDGLVWKSNNGGTHYQGQIWRYHMASNLLPPPLGLYTSRDLHPREVDCHMCCDYEVIILGLRWQHLLPAKIIENTIFYDYQPQVNEIHLKSKFLI